MVLIIIAFLVVGALELLIWLPPVWPRRQPLAVVVSVLLAAFSILPVVLEPQIWTVVLAVFSFYRLLNLGRLIAGRVQADYLYHASRRTALWLIGLQAIDLGLVELAGHYHLGQLSLLYAVAIGQTVVGLVLLVTTGRHLRTIRPPRTSTAYADSDLPSLTIALPARNETSDLEDCLRSLIASDYPKYEILVLDDCSQNKRTPEVIRTFAHDGVRFIAGQVPPGHWLAKNYAYSQLAEAANGELMLFCGVDARFEPGSLRALVETLLHKKKNMISLLPANQLPKIWKLIHLLVQPNRYAWELALPRRLLNRPPVLSTCWLIRRQTLQKSGGLAAVSRKIIPESYFARQTAADDDGYSFMESDAKIGISSHKSFDEQRATAIRTRYPQLHRRPEMIALVSLAEFSALVWPLIGLVGALISRAWLLAALSGIAYILVAVSYDKIVNVTYRRVIVGGMWLLPLAVVYDLGILNYSMWQYEFSQVIWKGRNICIPVMRVAPALPAANRARKQ